MVKAWLDRMEVDGYVGLAAREMIETLKEQHIESLTVLLCDLQL